MGTEAKAVSLTVEDGLATVRIARDHGNAINGDLVRELRSAYAEADEDAAVRGVLLAAGGKIFCPGLDLQELRELDRPAMKAFMAEFLVLVVEMFRFRKPVVAAVSGHALAGGIILALTADHRVLRRGALVGLNEVKVGVPLPFEVGVVLRHAAPPHRVAEVALLGRNFTDEEAVAIGLVHEVLAPDGFEARCRERLEEWASRDAAALAATKTWLREAAVREMLGASETTLESFLDAWFSPATRERIRQIVEQLREKGR